MTMKRILITGANSYIGTSFERWVSKWPDKYRVDTIDMIGEAWNVQSFSDMIPSFMLRALRIRIQETLLSH